MTIHINLLPRKPIETDIVLGLCPHQRETGIALLAGERLVKDEVLNLRKIPSGDGRERRFYQVLTGLLDAHNLTAMAVVVPEAEDKMHPFVRCALMSLEEAARERAIPLRRYTAGVIQRAFVDGSDRPSVRAVATCLACRFPELAIKAPPSDRGPYRTSRERYYRGMFLALGAAVLAEDEDLQHRFVTHSI